jgi:hypothetical protein
MRGWLYQAIFQAALAVFCVGMAVTDSSIAYLTAAVIAVGAVFSSLGAWYAGGAE